MRFCYLLCVKRILSLTFAGALLLSGVFETIRFTRTLQDAQVLAQNLREDSREFQAVQADLQNEAREQDFLKSLVDVLPQEKNFIRTLSAREVNELRKSMQSVNCSNCGAPIDLAGTSACPHCGSAISMLDMKQGEQLLAQLKRAADGVRPIEPAPLLEFAESHPDWQNDIHSYGLVQAGLSALARWLEKSKV